MAFQVERHLDEVTPLLGLSVHTLGGAGDEILALCMFVEDQKEIVWRPTVGGAELINPLDRFEKHPLVEPVRIVRGGGGGLFDSHIEDEAAQAFNFIEEPMREVPQFWIPPDVSHRVEAAPLLLPEGGVFP